MRLRSGFLAALALTAFVGCGGDDGGGKAKTTVALSIVRGSAPTGIDHVDVQVAVAATSFTVNLHKGASDSEFQLPFNTSVAIPDGVAGQATLTGIAFNAAGAELARGSVVVTVVTGQTTSVTLTFGQDTGRMDAGMPDASSETTAMLAIDRASASFPSTAVGARSAPQMFTVTNNGSLASGPVSVNLGGASPTSFELATGGTCTGALAGHATCSFGVVFHPDAAGPRSALVNVVSTPGGSVSALLDGTGLAPGLITLTPATADFGMVVQNADSSPMTFNVNNSGSTATGALTATLGGTDAAHFKLTGGTCSGMALAAGASCTVIVVFHPTTTGNHMASLTVAGTPGGSQMSSLSGRGLAPPALTVSPTSFDYSSILVNTTADAVFNVSNTGGVTTGPITATLTAGSEFSVFQSSCNTIAPGGNCAVVVRAAPTSMGPKTSTLTISGTPGGTLTVMLTATGIPPGALSLTPGTQDFGSTPVGTDGEMHTFTVTNTGGAPTGGIAATVSGSRELPFTVTGNTCGTGPLAPAATCTVTLTFHPLSRGAQTASLDVTATPGGTAVASLTGTGTAPAHLVADAISAPFGVIDVTRTSAPFVWTLTNDGDAATGPLAAVVAGDSTQFTTSNTCGTGALAPGASCTFTLALSPTSGGTKNLSISVTATPGGAVQLDASGTARALVTLTVAKAGAGAGTVSAAPSISCPGTCSAGYVFGTQVSVTTTNGAGGTFTGWSGACTGTQPCTVTMDQARSVTATFGVASYPINVSVVGNGTVTSDTGGINCGATCTASYPFNTVVTLTATPAAGSGFVGWNGCTSASSNVCTVTVSQATAVTASFSASGLPLSVAPQPTHGTVTSSVGGIVCGSGGSMCNSTATFGTMVTLTATPDANYHFTGWLGACSGTMTTCTVTIGSMPTVVGAGFAIDTHLLTVSRNGLGTVTAATGINCGQLCLFNYDHGTVVNLTATEVPGYRFDLWSGDCTGHDPNACTVTMNQAHNVSANFVQQFTLTATQPAGGPAIVQTAPSSPAINCGTTCSQVYDTGTSVTLTLVPAGAYQWGGGSCSGAASTPCTVSMTQARTVTATLPPFNVNSATWSSATGFNLTYSDPPNSNVSTLSNYSVPPLTVNTSVWSGGSATIALGTSNRTTTFAASGSTATVTYPYVVTVSNVTRAADNASLTTNSVAISGAPPAFTGALAATDPVFNRPGGACNAGPSTIGTAVNYDTLTFNNPSTVAANIVMTSSQVGGGGNCNAGDTVFILYNGAFNPASPANNCVAYDDDGAGNLCSRLAFTIPAGQTRTVVVSSYPNPPSGQFSYQLNFTGSTP